MKNTTRKSLVVIPIPDTFIYRANLLVKYQPEILVLTNRKGQIVGDDDVNLTGVDGYGD